MSPKYKSSERLIAKEAQVSYDFRVSVLDVHKHADRVRFFHGLTKPYFAVSDCCILRSEGHVTFACIEFRREQEDNDLDEDAPPKSNKGIYVIFPEHLVCHACNQISVVTCVQCEETSRGNTILRIKEE